MSETTDSLLTRLATERPTLYALMGEMAKKLLNKGHDYSMKDPEGLDNLLEAEEIDIPAWKGVLLRKGDKLTRIRCFAKRGFYKDGDDGFEDDLIDDANYDLLMILLHRRAREADRKPEPLVAPLTGTATFEGKVTATFNPSNPATWPLKEVRSALAGPPHGENPYPCPTAVVPRVQSPVPTPTERR